MSHTARTSARTLLVAAGAAGFVALGSGIAGANALGGVTDGLNVGDLGSQVPASLTEGVASPVGDLAKVEPGELSATPDIVHNSAPADAAGHVVGDTVSTETLMSETDNATDVGPLDLNTMDRSVPLAAGGGDPVGGLLGPVLGLLDGAGGGDPLGGTLGGVVPQSKPVTGPPAHADASPQARVNQVVRTVSQTAEKPERTLGEVGALAGSGTQEVDTDLVGLDKAVPMSAPVAGEDLVGGLGLGTGTLPLAAAENPVALDTGENTDLTGGAGDLLPELNGGVSGAEEALPLAAPETVGGDLVGVDGVPRVGEPEVGLDPVTGMVLGGLV